MNDSSKNFRRTNYKRYLSVILGMLLCAFSYNIFLLPNDIVFGGLSGISIIVSKFVNIIPSLFIFVCSLFIAIFSYFLLGKEVTIRALIGSSLYALFVELTSFITDLVQVPNDDLLLISIFGGVLYGIGLGFVMRGGFTAGGTDMITNIFSKYLKIPTGSSMILVEGVIVIIGTFVFGISNLLYAIIILFLITTLVDKVMLGISDKKAFYIITSEKKKVSNFVINEISANLSKTLLLV